MANKYHEQAHNFLYDTNSRLIIRLAIPQKCPLWANCSGGKHLHGKHYSIILKSPRDIYTFDFWGSIKDKQDNKIPSAYDVLACLSVYEFLDFDDFCANYGYNNDSIKAHKIYLAVLKEQEHLKALYTGEELEQLNEIN